MARRRYQKGSLLPKSGPPKNGLWIGRWREDVIQPDGTIRRPYKWEVLGKIRDYPTRKLALRALEARLSTINSPTYRARPTARFAEFANQWDATVLSQHKRSTQSSTRSQLRKWLLPQLGSVALKDLDGQRLQAFVSNCKCNARTVRNLVATLRMMWTSARSWGYVAHDPFDGLVLPKRGLVQTFAFSLEEIKRIVDSANEPHKTFYSILAEAGIRGGEICALRVADLDLEKAVIYVRQSVWRGQIQTVKSKKGNRRFPISPELVEHIRAYLLTWRPNTRGLVFATKNGTPWDHSLLRKRKFHPLLRNLGISQCGFHAFRHGNATLLDQIGAPMAVRQNRLGHADAQTTMGYTHAVTADERRIAEDLGKILHATARSEQKNSPAPRVLSFSIQ
ncbi:MAG: site-specific integrase [Candidatus Korobacteraceae bacterium]